MVVSRDPARGFSHQRVLSTALQASPQPISVCWKVRESWHRFLHPSFRGAEASSQELCPVSLASRVLGFTQKFSWDTLSQAFVSQSWQPLGRW